MLTDAIMPEPMELTDIYARLSLVPHDRHVLMLHQRYQVPHVLTQEEVAGASVWHCGYARGRHRDERSPLVLMDTYREFDAAGGDLLLAGALARWLLQFDHERFLYLQECYAGPRQTPPYVVDLRFLRVVTPPPLFLVPVLIYR